MVTFGIKTGKVETEGLHALIFQPFHKGSTQLGICRRKIVKTVADGISIETRAARHHEHLMSLRKKVIDEGKGLIFIFSGGVWLGYGM